MVYCAGKLIENLKSFYKSNRPHFLWVYLRDNPLQGWDVGKIRLVIYRLFSCSSKRGEVQEGKSPCSLLFQPISLSARLFQLRKRSKIGYFTMGKIVIEGN